MSALGKFDRNDGFAPFGYIATFMGHEIEKVTNRRNFLSLFKAGDVQITKFIPHLVRDFPVSYGLLSVGSAAHTTTTNLNLFELFYPASPVGQHYYT